MAMYQKYPKLICNGILFIMLGLAIALCLLNVINPKIPALKCEGNIIKEPNISHKYNGETVTTVKLFSAVLLAPFLQILITEWFRNRENSYMINSNESSRWRRTLFRASRWFRDYIFGFMVVILLNDIAKTTINSPRPHWLDSCKPNFTIESCQLGWLQNYECTNSEISSWKLADARKSFPSGHSALSFYVAVFMGMYQHKRVSPRYIGMISIIWLHTLWFGYAIFCCLSRVADHRHHPVDVAFGALIGAIGGIFTVRILCKEFGKTIHPSSYQNKVNSGGNGSTTILDGFPNGQIINSLPPGMNGGSRNENKRHSLKRLLSTQSTVTQMSDIAEDRELDSL